MVLLAKLNNAPTEDFYLVERGFETMLRAAIMFACVSCVLVFEKCHYFKTKKQL